MNVWYHLSTIFSQRYILRSAVILTLCVALITTLFFTSSRTFAAPGGNQTISFQGRLSNGQGQAVADGYYNIQFKIYQDGSGIAAGNPNSTLQWTETYLNNGGNSGVYVKNGYFSVALGSKTSFDGKVDWNEDTLWLSMNVAGSSTSCATFNSAPCVADGEMLPMKRITATPLALNSNMVGGKTVNELIHNSTSQQAGNFNISGTGIAGVLQGSTGVTTPLLDTIAPGSLSIGTANATSIAIGSTGGNQTISIGTGTGTNSLTIGSTSGESSVTIQGGSMGVAVNSASDVSIGLGENGAFTIKNSSNESVLSIQDNGNTLFSQAVISKTSIGAQSSDSSTTTSISSDNDGTGKLSTTGNVLQLQGGAVPINLLTAVNNNGSANIGIGNSAEKGYALDVTGQINASNEYLINGVSVLSNNTLSFDGTTSSIINSAEGQALQLNADGGVKLGDGSATTAPTLLTLDKSSAAPTATGDDILGSMYYDTTLGKVQCYEADGWGSCSASPDNFVTLSPEYTNAVTNGTGTGEFTSDICSDALNINDGSGDQPAICGENETFNFYKWTTDQTSAQTKDIYVTYQLPTNFTGFVEGSTSLIGRTDSNDSSVRYQVYKNSSTGLVPCGGVVDVSSGPQTTWQKSVAIGSADPSKCHFSANDSIVFRITLSSQHATKTTNAYASTLSFAFSND